MNNDKVISVIDIGTNTTRLLVRKSGSSQDILREVEITRLGSDIEATGRLGSKGMETTREVVAQFVKKALSCGSLKSEVRIFATAACRNSSNGKDFVESLAQEFGCDAEIISGELEGQLSFKGALSGYSNLSQSCVVFDIGGGSTEFAVSSIDDPKACKSVISVPIGSVRITKRHLESDPPKPEELSNAIADIREHLNDVEMELTSIRNNKLWIGVAATVTTTAAIELGLHEFDAQKIHQMVLTKEMVEDVFRTLATEKFEDRIHNPGLEKERADVIVGGVAIVAAIMRHFELAEITVSCTDLLDGLWLHSGGPSFLLG